MAHAAQTTKASPAAANADAIRLVGPRPSPPSRILKRARSARAFPPTPPSTPSLRVVSPAYRRRRHLQPVCAGPEVAESPLSELSDSEFVFSSPFCSDNSASDSESLPDLVESTPGSVNSESPATPSGGRVSYFDSFESPLKRLSSAPVLRSALLSGKTESIPQPTLQPFSNQPITTQCQDSEMDTDEPELPNPALHISETPNTIQTRFSQKLQHASGDSDSQTRPHHLHPLQTQYLQPSSSRPKKVSEVGKLPFSSPFSTQNGHSQISPFQHHNPQTGAIPHLQPSSGSTFHQKPPQHHTPSIFEIPELVHQIIVFADAQNTVVPGEKPPICRKPLSYRHALLMHGNEQAAKSAMEGAFAFSDHNEPTNRSNVLHTCLLVNKLFHRIAKEVIGERLFFTDEAKFEKFAASDKSEITRSCMFPKQLIVSKMFFLRQSQFNVLAAKTDLRKLEWLELYMCPRLTPTIHFLQPTLKTLIVTGSKALDDSILVEVARTCPNLETLDVRACENVTDHGIYSIGQACKKLVTLNLGRKKRGHLITDHSVCAVAANNPNLTTVGVAGCYITDRSIWQLALTCGRRLERLSLNNCPYITDQSVPVVLDHNLMKSLTVLEIRFVDRITNFKPIITYKRRQAARGFNVLVETCEELLMRMREQERTMDRIISERVVHDISEWANGKDDDMAAADLFRARGRRSALA